MQRCKYIYFVETFVPIFCINFLWNEKWLKNHIHKFCFVDLNLKNLSADLSGIVKFRFLDWGVDFLQKIQQFNNWIIKIISELGMKEFMWKFPLRQKQNNISWKIETIYESKKKFSLIRYTYVYILLEAPLISELCVWDFLIIFILSSWSIPLLIESKIYAFCYFHIQKPSNLSFICMFPQIAKNTLEN